MMRHHWIFTFIMFFIGKDGFESFVLFLNLFSLMTVLNFFPHESLWVSKGRGTPSPLKHCSGENLLGTARALDFRFKKKPPRSLRRHRGHSRVWSFVQQMTAGGHTCTGNSSWNWWGWEGRAERRSLRERSVAEQTAHVSEWKRSTVQGAGGAGPTGSSGVSGSGGNAARDGGFCRWWDRHEATCRLPAKCRQVNTWSHALGCFPFCAQHQHKKRNSRVGPPRAGPMCRDPECAAGVSPAHLLLHNCVSVLRENTSSFGVFL